MTVCAADTPGKDRPFGAHPGEGGVTFTVFSRHATWIDVVFFGMDGGRETGRIRLAREAGSDVHHGFAADVAPGTRYGLIADGPHDPELGLLFDPAKLLVDPYAREIDRPFRWHPRLAIRGERTADLVPRAIITDLRPAIAPQAPRFRPGGLIYEIPVRSFTMRHPGVPDRDRGTLKALTSPAVIAHLKALHVDAVELMPITAWIDERHLDPLGLTNAWGYNPVAMMALDPRLAPGGITDLRETVDVLHAAGIDVFLDVVFNHTGESDLAGPTLSLRGLDNTSYYRHHANDPGKLVNDTGCGNTLACDQPPVRRLILDTLRHFVIHAGIDGFRFDLAPILGRDGEGFRVEATLFEEIANDPVLSTRVMIAEPWDIGPGGYRLGQFPDMFLEWNDRYRDDVRRFWRGDGHGVGALATRLAGSADIFRRDGASTSRSVNFIAAHDGFTLADLTAYERKHNHANGENNRDGHNENLSWNNGVEGLSNNPSVLSARQHDAIALVATLFVSRGTIMLTAGDEFGRTQFGNNNAYAQDNDTTWLDWENRNRDIELASLALSRTRRRISQLNDPTFLDESDVRWLRPDGEPMQVADWENPEVSALTMVLDTQQKYQPSVAALFNRSHESLDFSLAAMGPGPFRIVFPEPERRQDLCSITVAPRSVMIALVS